MWSLHFSHWSVPLKKKKLQLGISLCTGHKTATSTLRAKSTPSGRILAAVAAHPQHSGCTGPRLKAASVIGNSNSQAASAGALYMFSRAHRAQRQGSPRARRKTPQDQKTRDQKTRPVATRVVYRGSTAAPLVQATHSVWGRCMCLRFGFKYQGSIRKSIPPPGQQGPTTADAPGGHRKGSDPSANNSPHPAGQPEPRMPGASAGPNAPQIQLLPQRERDKRLCLRPSCDDPTHKHT